MKKALREVYNNHAYYKKCALLARNWVEQYTAQNLKQKYINLVRPKEILLGTKNEISETGLITNSKKLYNTYQRILSKKDGQ